MKWITFDIETYSPSKLNHIDTKEFRASVIGAYISWLDKYIAFFEEDVADFLELILDADVVVGFNQKWFDLPVLQKYSHDFDLLTYTNNYDILIEVEKKLGYKVKLNDLCKANFGDDIKTDSFEQYKNYYWDEKWFELVDYCMNDVRLTNLLFLKVLKGESIKYKDFYGIKEIILDKPQIIKIDRPQKDITDSLL